MPSCTVITMASRRSMSSLVFREMPLAVFCRTGAGACQRPFNHGLHLDQDMCCSVVVVAIKSVCCIKELMSHEDPAASHGHSHPCEPITETGWSPHATRRYQQPPGGLLSQADISGTRR